MNLRIAVLIPCYNEELTIKDTVQEFRSVLPDAKIFVFDNNSTDKSPYIVENETDAILVYSKKQGKGNVVQDMFAHVDADIYLMTDADCTYPASYAPEMIAGIASGEYDMVIGDRLSSNYAKDNKRPFHNVGNNLVRWLVNHLFKGNITDVMTGYRAFSRDFVKSVRLHSTHFEVETELSIRVLQMGSRLKAIPILYRDRPKGSKSKLSTYKDGYKVIKFILQEYKQARSEARNRVKK